MARLIKATGGEKEITPQNGKKFELDEAQELVVGYIQVIRLDDDMVMVLDEEGKLKEDCRFNATATKIARMHKRIFSWDYIVGNAIICKNAEI